MHHSSQQMEQPSQMGSALWGGEGGGGNILVEKSNTHTLSVTGTETGGSVKLF